MFPVPDVMRTGDDLRVHALEKTYAVANGAHRRIFATAVGVALGAENGDVHLVPFFQAESPTRLGCIKAGLVWMISAWYFQ